MNLYQALVVEDNAVYRHAVRTIVDWEQCGFEIAAEAVSGRQALELLGKRRFDLILTDVSMPEMNGIDLVKAVKARDPDILVVMLSSYDDFRFVKDSLKLGAEDYLLKQELEPETLRRMLEQMKRRLGQLAETKRREAARLAELRTIVLKQWLTGETPPVPAADGIVPPDGCRLALLAWRPDEDDGFRLPAEDAGRAIAVPIRTGRLVLLDTGSRSDGDGEFASRRIAKRWLREAGGRSRAAAVAAGEGGAGAGRLRAAYRAAEEALFRTVYDGWGQLFEAERRQEAERAVDPQRIVRWREALRGSDLDELADALADLFRELRRRKPAMATLKQHLVDLYVSLFGRAEYGGGMLAGQDWLTELTDSLERLDSLDAIQERLLAVCRERCGPTAASSCRKEIRQALAYIREHYAEDISVAELSRHLGFSPNYLSSLFRSETGLRVTEYVSRVRMEMAKRLLRNTPLKVYEVASQVGYQETSYFCKVFKEVTGETVTAFRRKE